VDAIQAGASAGVANFSYAFDTIGNLTSRGDANEGVAETFTYDVLKRLTAYSVTQTGGTINKTVVYNDIGNILSKTDVGTYTYAAAGNALPHAVASVSGLKNTTYTYDDNGSVAEAKERVGRYLAFYNTRRPHSSHGGQMPTRHTSTRQRPSGPRHNQSGDPLIEHVQSVQTKGTSSTHLLKQADSCKRDGFKKYPVSFGVFVSGNSRFTIDLQ